MAFTTWPHWSRNEIDALRKSQVVMGGAFQDLYRKEIGRTVLFEEDVQDTAPLAFDQIVLAGWLPEELLNRAGLLGEVRPPGKEEILERLERVEGDAGIAGFDIERERTAWMIVTGMQGMSGLENCALQLAMELLRKKGDSK